MDNEVYDRLLGKSKQSKNPPLSDKSPHSKIPYGAKRIGNYILGKAIGQGNFGKVHLGLHLPTGYRVAVKIIEKVKILEKDIHRVKSYIKILSSTRHPNLIHLYEIIETERSLLLITEYMPNGELFKHILKYKRLQETEACAKFQQIISAVHYLHRNGIAHRDMKPYNILIDHNNRLKIIDFGLSSFYDRSIKKLKSQCGSPCYAAPYMIEGRRSYDPYRVDIWSCGVILYTMVCGALPFCHSDTSLLFKKILSGCYKYPPFISPSLKDLIDHLLVVDPAGRFTLQQIIDHDWFNLLPYENSPCIAVDEKLRYYMEIVRKTKYLGFNYETIISGLEKNYKNKYTGTYFLVMKKMAKEGHRVRSYVESDHFDPNYVYKTCPYSEGEESTNVVTLVESPSPEIPNQLHVTKSNECDAAPLWWTALGTKDSYNKLTVPTTFYRQLIFKYWSACLNPNRRKYQNSKKLPSKNLLAAYRVHSSLLCKKQSSCCCLKQRLDKSKAIDTTPPKQLPQLPQLPQLQQLQQLQQFPSIVVRNKTNYVPAPPSHAQSLTIQRQSNNNRYNAGISPYLFRKSRQGRCLDKYQSVK